MTVEVEIAGGSGEKSYEIVVTAKDLDILAKASQHPDIRQPDTEIRRLGEEMIQSVEGEKLVSLLLKVAKGGILQIERRKDGKLQDGIKGEPAYQTFHDNGQPAKLTHYTAGVIDDPISFSSSPAQQAFDANGVLRKSFHSSLGVLTDSRWGDPAIQEFGPDGRIVLSKRFTGGRLSDGKGGEPAVQSFNPDGSLKDAARFSDGVQTKTLDAEELAAYVRNVATVAGIKAANPGLKIRTATLKP